MTEWIEISLTADGEGAEAASDVLRRYTDQGIVIERSVPGGEAWPSEITPNGPLVIKTYIPADEYAPAVQRQIEEALYYVSRLYPIPAPSFRALREEDWAEAWKKDFHPIRVGKHLVIRPSWTDFEVDAEDIVIELDPGMAFGTGTHPTTQLCLQACEWFAHSCNAMVDLGTGSGILAIAAAKLGCSQIVACDIDEDAVEAARQNAVSNGVEHQVIVQRGSLDGLITSDQHFDLGMANITANIILDMAHHDIQHILYPSGHFIFSGILQEQADEVISALAAAELTLLDQLQMGEWIMLVTQRQGK
ncbi:MAG: 50S ribosomal protein L11 methyltransferase [Anaerolineae bacterium]|nr:50S ribosomal protein L11 methyltransferase [Anaerolineae bacterium]